MSKSASWAYKATATVWHKKDRSMTGEADFYPPVLIDCAYKLRDSLSISGYGSEASGSSEYYTEYANIFAGDFIILGDFNNSNPNDVDAAEVATVERYMDPFDGLDDYKIVTV